ncbi:MAG: AAA family ATPase [Firmicutes bacterium]|nr:AAA family ATPase [Bacillota bacterium]
MRTSPIQKITLNAATFSGVSFMPTAVSFFYGGNGTGKSTIASAVGRAEGLTFLPGKSAADYSALVFNQEFIAENFRGYGNLKGVFTVGKHNAEIQSKIAQKSDERAELERSTIEKTTQREQKASEKNALAGFFQESCWVGAKTLRERFGAALSGAKLKASFAQKALETQNPQEHDEDALAVLCDAAFDPRAAEYPEFRLVGEVIRLKGTRGNELLAKVITGSGGTEFSRFINAISAADWVRAGHARYAPLAGGKCPYCQEELPDDFDAQFAGAFDGQYQAEVEALKSFQSAYAGDMREFISVLRENLQGAFPKLELAEYKSKLELFEQAVEVNLKRIADKIKEPSQVIGLENLKPLRAELNGLIEGFNRQIRTSNAVVAAKREKKAECTQKVWQHIAHALKSELAYFRTNQNNLEGEIAVLSRQISDGAERFRVLDAEISALNKSVISAAPAVEGINGMLRDADFSGFYLRPKAGKASVYEVVREDGSVADNLSEGERGFIAFFYFCHLVRGSFADDGAAADTIVVIDDPVSGLDDDTVSLVADAVCRIAEDCLADCLQGQDGFELPAQACRVKQLFVLTHNARFYAETIAALPDAPNAVSHFTVTKERNVSTVKMRDESKAANSGLWAAKRE